MENKKRKSTKTFYITPAIIRSLGKTNVSIPKNKEPESLTEEECVALLAEKEKRKKGKKSKKKSR